MPNAAWDNRIVEYDPAVPLDQLLAHPRNPKIHPRPQTDALKGILGDVGWLTGLIVNTTTGHVLDGHDRIKAAMEAGQSTAPVFYVSVPEAQEPYILATFDPVGTLAATDSTILTELLREVSSEDSAVQELLSKIAEDAGAIPADWAGAFDALPDGERAGFQQMTFTVTDAQAELVQRALAQAKHSGPFGDTGNENSNGNALARVCESYVS
jgi:hypothetical protein